jgi:purine-binding chemotaxis protein CheW
MGGRLGDMAGGSERPGAHAFGRARSDDPAFVERVLKLRARRLAENRGRDDQSGSPGHAVLCFAMAGENYAIALGELAEVMPLTVWTPVPGQPQQLLGVVNVRGEIRPVLDLHAMLTLPAPEAGQGGYVAFLRNTARKVGVRVDSLERIRFIDAATLTRPHETANGLPQRFVAGITPDTLILLDARQILALDVLQDRRADYRHVL